MGSKKYPDENDFDAFIRKRGGSDNASTECEQTTFYFEIDEKYLLGALDRFAQFFISPLMYRDAISREREAVESGKATYSFLVQLYNIFIFNNQSIKYNKL